MNANHTIRRWASIASLLLAVGLCSSAPGALIAAYQASDTSAVTGKLLSAYVSFETTGSTGLKIILTNTGAPAEAPADVLTGLFFRLSNPSSLSPQSITFTDGSDGWVNPPAPGNASDLRRHWQYKALSPTVHGANAGIGASGLGGTFSHGNFGGVNGAALQGVNYGIVDDLGPNPNGGIGSRPFVSNSLSFTLGGYQGQAIDEVYFQYGSSLSEPGMEGQIIPEPATASLIGLGGFLALCRRPRRRN